MAEHYDIAVIGAGPGGYVAAIRAAQLGFKTVCIDKNTTLGGTCLNVGCIPSKTLLHTTELFYHLRKDAKEKGITFGDLKIDFPQMMKKKEEVIKSLVDGIAGLFKGHHITSMQGSAEFIDPHKLRIISQDVATSEIEVDNIIIATGSEPIPLKELPFNGKQVVSSTGALNFKSAPQRLVVIGAGVIGVELASVFQRLGSEVKIIEMLDHICPAIDKHLSKQLLQLLKKQGIEFSLSSRLVTGVVQPDEVILTVDEDEKLSNVSATAVLVAIGRRPFTEGLGLDRIGIKTDKRGFIPVNDRFQTIHPNIFAIGDVIDGAMLAHRASTEGVAVVESLAGLNSIVDYLAIPNVIYTFPEVATIGLTDEEAKAAKIDTMVGTSYFRGNPRARCTGEAEGLVKIVGDKTSGRLIGMHILGPHASEIISEGMIAMQKKLAVADLGDAPQAHPTLSEAIKEAALDALGKAIHH